ncbi:protein UXT homolog isoform X2 [Neocloeon triangulifer]|uniref:protein UXT homolog isoform X2 n=1 Tax=Neocloeon triangulifer TaxID=2078957 RepID=UPI00286F582E|nr:protein UXT homolog isoform X2 [Neocloeon triangulifer]XP_059471201.1 protein UXT homolog isoform X2 [Neocloeon triangulifer]XP_059471202.1 protein UXT homolog isoform X2 [Neocloeon triangulifer]
MQPAATRERIFSSMLLSQKEDLKIAYERREKMKQELVDYTELKHTVELMIDNKDIKENGLQTSVNLGCDFYVDAVVKKPDRILVSLGLDLFMEYTLSDALMVVNAKLKVLEHQIEYMTSQIAQIESHITLATMTLGQDDAHFYPSDIEHLSAESLAPKLSVVEVIQKDLLNRLK